MTSAQKIARYVEAVREYRSLKAQTERYPELLDRPNFKHEFGLAKTRVSEYIRCLTGGQIGEAARILNQTEKKEETV